MGGSQTSPSLAHTRDEVKSSSSSVVSCHAVSMCPYTPSSSVCVLPPKSFLSSSSFNAVSMYICSRPLPSQDGPAMTTLLTQPRNTHAHALTRSSSSCGWGWCVPAWMSFDFRPPACQHTPPRTPSFRCCHRILVYAFTRTWCFDEDVQVYSHPQTPRYPFS